MTSIGIFDLPLELRHQIYALLTPPNDGFDDANPRLEKWGITYQTHRPPPTSLYLVCKTLTTEIRDYYFDRCTFVQQINDVKHGTVSPGRLPSRPGQTRLRSSPILRSIKHFNLRFQFHPTEARLLPTDLTDRATGLRRGPELEQYCWLTATSLHAALATSPPFRSLKVTFVLRLEMLDSMTASALRTIAAISVSRSELVPLTALHTPRLAASRSRTSSFHRVAEDGSLELVPARTRRDERSEHDEPRQRCKANVDYIPAEFCELGIEASLLLENIPSIPLSLYRDAFATTLRLLGVLDYGQRRKFGVSDG